MARLSEEDWCAFRVLAGGGGAMFYVKPPKDTTEEM